MRLVLVAAALVATAVVPSNAATTPPPASCSAVAQGAVVPADPGGLTATSAVVVYGAEVVCTRNPLTTPPIDHATSFQGDLSLELRAADGTILCGGNPQVPGRFSSVSSVLVMANENVCVVPYSDPHRLQPMYVRGYWATMPTYSCCADVVAWITPAGANVKL